jgi:hypothetical protein
VRACGDASKAESKPSFFFAILGLSPPTIPAAAITLPSPLSNLISIGFCVHLRERAVHIFRSRHWVESCAHFAPPLRHPPPGLGVGTPLPAVELSPDLLRKFRRR